VKRNKVSKDLDRETHLGYGEPLMGFWPYFLQAHMSEESPSAGTWHTFFIKFFLYRNTNQNKTQKQKRTQKSKANFSSWTSSFFNSFSTNSSVIPRKKKVKYNTDLFFVL